MATKDERGRPSRERAVALGAKASAKSERPKASGSELFGATVASDSNAQNQRAETSAAGFELGSVLAGRYRILELLGQGGMGAVYRARDLTLGEDVAVKLLAPELADDPSRVDYFRNEVLLARRVTHPNVCRLHDIACEDGLWFITMEFIDGESLADRLSRADRADGSSDRAEIERIFTDVASGLAAAHAVGVVHRDLKPANVLIRADSGRAVVADFGIAIELNQLGAAQEVDVAGTRGYMSPEQAAGDEIDARSDVFALGVLGHRMLTGELPAVAATRTGTVGEPTDGPADVPATPPENSESLSNVIARCLQTRPTERPKDAGGVLELLASPPSGRRRRWLAVSGLALAGSAIAIVFALRPSGGPGVPLTIVPPRVIVDHVDASALDPKHHWYGEAFSRRLANELEDAWGVDAHVSGDSGVVPTEADLRLSVSLSRRQDLALSATIQVRQYGHVQTVEQLAPTFQDLAELASSEVMTLVPPALRRPHPVELERSAINHADAWRLWRRAQRASLRQQWTKSRTLAAAAIEADPECVPCLIEYGWSFGADDKRRLEPITRALTLSDGLSLNNSLMRVLDFARADVAGDVAAMSAMLAEVLDDRWSHRDRRYYSFRAYARLWFDGFREAAAPQLEMHVELFPRVSGVAKMLAEHFLELDGRDESRQALEYSKLAVTRGADDVGARAQLARALLHVGKRDEALREVAIIESAEATEKQRAIAGGERTNTLFDLYMALGDRRAASQAARRLYNGGPNQKAAAAEALAHLAYLRGDRIRGNRLHREAQRRHEESNDEPFAAAIADRRIWIQFAADDCAKVIGLIEDLRKTQAHPHHAVLEQLCRHRLAGTRKNSPALKAALKGGSELRSVRHKALIGLILAVEIKDWDKALKFEDVVRLGRMWIGAYHYLGVAAEGVGDLERAAKWHELLAEHRFAWLRPITSTRSRLHAARLREKLGQTEQAKAHYRAYVETLDQASPNQEGLSQAKRGLERLP